MPSVVFYANGQEIITRSEKMSKNEIENAVVAFKAKTHGLILQLNRYAGDAARQFPAEYVASERARIRGELASLDRAFTGEVARIHERQISVADETYAKDPRDPASVTADELQIQRLSRQYPERVSARNHLLPEARRYVQIGEPERARVYLEAARLAGAVDGQVERDIERAFDSRLPNRVAALEARHESVSSYTEAQMAAAMARNLTAVLVGDVQGAASASITAKQAALQKARLDGVPYRDPGTLTATGRGPA